MSARARIGVGIALAAALGLGCGVPEQALRDEQNRSRKFRDAYENEHDENTALKARLEKLDLEKSSCASGVAPSAAQH